MPAEIPDGGVIIARAILRSPIWRMRPEDCKVAITLIALVNHSPGQWFDGTRQVTIKKGQLIRSREKLAGDCKLSIQVLRSCLKRLESKLDKDGIPFLTRKSTKRYTLYTLPKYPFYQDLRNYGGKANQQLTNQKGISNQRHMKNQPTGNQPSTPSKPHSKSKLASSPSSTQQPLFIEPPSKGAKANHKQEQQQQEQFKQEQTRPPSDASTDPARPLEVDRPGGETTPSRTPVQPLGSLLDQVNYRRGVLLLLSVGIKEEAARGLAADRPIGELVDVVQASRRAANPGGYVIDAIRKGWGVPRAEAARAEIFAELKADHEKAEASIITRPPKYPRLPGETADQWIHRVNDLRKAEKLEKSKR